MGILSDIFAEEGKSVELAKELSQSEERVAIPFDLVERIFELYCLDYTFSAIARDVGVVVSTVSKYVNSGDSDRGIPPLRERRRDVYLQAIQDKNGEMAIRFRNLLKVAVDSATVTGSRFIERVEAAKELEDSSLYESGNETVLAAKNQKAYNPDSKSLARILGVAANVLAVGGKMFQEGSPSINVNTQAQAGVSQQLSLGPAEVIVDHFNNLRGCVDSEATGEIAEIIKKISLGSENAENVENIGNSEIKKANIKEEED